MIAPVHRDGEAYTAAMRIRMREEGLLGQEERDLTRLKPLHLTEAQQEHWVNYEPGRVVEFHQPVAGGFQSGQQWTVMHAASNGVTVTRKGHEKVLSLDKVTGFSVYETETMPVSVGDDLQMTKNSRRGRNGDVHRVKGFDDNEIVLDNGCRMDLDRAHHVRQGHTVTSQVSQSKERDKMFCLAMTSALPQINAAQALVDVSRAQGEARIYTDSIDSFEVKVQADTGHRQAAIDFLDGNEAKVSLSREQGIEVNLQEQRGRGLRPDARVQRYEAVLRERLSEKYQYLPDEKARRLETKIQEAVEAYRTKLQRAAVSRPGQARGVEVEPPWRAPSQDHGRGMSMGF